MKSIIIGYGEVGQGLYSVLTDNYFDIDTLDAEDEQKDLKEEYDIIHICFGFSDQFIEAVKTYQQRFKPKYTIIHSTVPVGTSRQIGAVHSPIRGIHPNLEGGIRTFPKFLGGEQSSEVADYFRRAGMKVILFDKSETTEALKLFDTEYYRTCIEFAQRVKLFCDKNNLNFSEVYTIPNQTYNEGYTKLGMPEVVRPVLQPIMKVIGGHCLVPNSKLIKLSE